VSYEGVFLMSAGEFGVGSRHELLVSCLWGQRTGMASMRTISVYDACWQSSHSPPAVVSEGLESWPESSLIGRLF